METDSGGRWRRSVLALSAVAALMLGGSTALVLWTALDERDGLDCLLERTGVITSDGTGRDGAPTPRDAVLTTEWWATLGLPPEARVFSDEDDPELGITVADDEPAGEHGFVVHVDGRAQVRFSVERGLDGTYAISGVTTCYDRSG